ncbi:hypothetical protein [Geodermatophilus obscurus]|uniref:hypothetical protein n=1 Tax=Geodermatophilus obscurus TaxID=1861 RepID=UPI00019B74AF|nr:hypothetical protein [Geodermatophilus obscurus]
MPPGERATQFPEAGDTLALIVDASVYPEMLDAVLTRAESDSASSATVDAPSARP